MPIVSFLISIWLFIRILVLPPDSEFNEIQQTLLQSGFLAYRFMLVLLFYILIILLLGNFMKKYAELNKPADYEESLKIKEDDISGMIDESDLIDVVQFLKSNEKCKFRQLIDIAGVDYPEEEKRFQLVYLFLSHENNNRIKLSVKFHSDQTINSITKIFPSANWMEREVFDMYGIKFKNHPDMRRILTDYGS